MASNLIRRSSCVQTRLEDHLSEGCYTKPKEACPLDIHQKRGIAVESTLGSPNSHSSLSRNSYVYKNIKGIGYRPSVKNLAIDQNFCKNGLRVPEDPMWHQISRQNYVGKIKRTYTDIYIPRQFTKKLITYKRLLDFDSIFLMKIIGVK